MKNFIIKNNRYKNIFFKIIPILFWIILWHILSLIINKEILLVSPFVVLKNIFKIIQKKEFYKVILNSTINVFLGFFLGLILGIISGTLSYFYPLIKNLLSPFLNFIKSVPVASIVILCLVYIKAKNLSIIVSFLIVYPVYYFNILEGFSYVDIKLIQMANVFKVKKFKKFIYIYILQLFPYFISASNIALGSCWKSGIAAEVIGIPKNTIGEKLYNAKIFFNTGDLFAWTIIIIIVSFLFEKLFLKIFNLILKKIEGV